MFKSKFTTVFVIVLFGVFSGSTATIAYAANSANSAGGSQPVVVDVASKNAKKKYTLNFDDETVTGEFEAPDTMVMSTRGLMKYKELFNKRINFIAEAESTKGMFNEYKK